MQVEPSAVLAADRAETRARIETLSREYAAVVAASTDANVDDEHDPEGATIAFERAQLGAVLDQARRRLGDLDVALKRVEAGAYATCERCRGPISAQRLAARPAARTCIDCAWSVH